MPSILFINRVYPPSEGATGRVLEHLAEGFVTAGWGVSVLVTGDISGNLTMRNGVRIYSAGGGVLSKSGIFLRALGYALMIPRFLFYALKIPRADLVVTMTDPPMLLSIGGGIKFFKKSRLIHWAQDLYPEAAEALGVLPPQGVVAQVLRTMAHCSLRAHALTIVPGRCMKKQFILGGLPASKIRVISNSGVEQRLHVLPRFPNAFRERHRLGEALLVEYSGNIGLAHEFDTVIAAARLLQEMGETEILFLFIGSGSREASLRDEVKRRGLHNVHFFPSQPENKLSESLGAGDLHLVTMREEMAGLVVPSKFYGAMASSRPCLFIGPKDSEVACDILESESGCVIAPHDAQHLVEKILEYRNFPSIREEAGAKGAAWVRGKDSLKQFLSVASEVAAG
jgi:glycosyltransferase involved in cell wall biosynthesis